MFIGLIGPPCSGKSLIAEYLKETCGFQDIPVQGGVEEILEFVTRNWKDNWVLPGLERFEDLSPFRFNRLNLLMDLANVF